MSSNRDLNLSQDSLDDSASFVKMDMADGDDILGVISTLITATQLINSLDDSHPKKAKKLVQAEEIKQKIVKPGLALSELNQLSSDVSILHTQAKILTSGVAKTLKEVRAELDRCVPSNASDELVLGKCKFFMTNTYTSLKHKITIKQVERLATDIDHELHGKPPLSRKVKMLIGALLGALVGLVIGAAVGSLLGGFGAIPGGFLGLVKGLTIGTAIAGGSVLGGSLIGSSMGFFSSKKSDDERSMRTCASQPSQAVKNTKECLLETLRQEAKAKSRMKNLV